MYKDLSKLDIKKLEEKQRDYWNSIDLLSRCISERSEKSPFIFYEGPPTANARPGVHHMLARALKDAVCRYQTMKGKKVIRKAGWDTHGLPVELEVEKNLGIKNKTEIENLGVDKFNKACRDSVFEYESKWRELTEKMAYLIDMDHPYITLDNDYIETEWWILDKFRKEGYIYEGHKILPYCSRCGTGLASHEVAQGYKEIKNNSVIVKFKSKTEDLNYLVWTTTPWTLIANVALSVNPDEIYIKAKKEDEIFVLAKNLANKVLEENYEILEEFSGKELENKEYEQLMNFCKTDKPAFKICLADYVTTADGTGIVHTAPAFGEDDYKTSQKYDLPVIQPVDEDGNYTEGPWKGRNVLTEELEVDIIIWLHDKKLLFSKQKIAHNYPHCWRCHTPLLYYAKKSWYIEMTKLRDKMVELNKTVNWQPVHVGEKRFGNWLENVNDWAISRTRYWGTPLNLWKCSCSNLMSVSSRAELVERAIEDIDESIELHRPYVDDIHIKCDKCGEKVKRVPDVIDCWFDSGSMPFAQYHYPFENKEILENAFPADFICEGVDQTRGWFYSLMAISSFITGKAPYKSVLVNDLVLDKDGKKMSKTRGNTVDPFKLMDELGADAIRWYMYYASPVWLPTKFDVSALKEVNSKFFGTLKNSYTFFSLYANMDNINTDNFYIDYKNLEDIDKWILSKLNKLIKLADESFEKYDLTRLARAAYDFIIEDFSNWYIRRNRRRFWESELTDEKKAVYQTTRRVLYDFSKIIAPLAPYSSEEIFRNLSDESSVHLSLFPEYNENEVSNEIEEKMDLVRDLVKLGRAARENAKIKIRQPLKNIFISAEYKDLISDLLELIKEELNIKEITFEENLSLYMDFKLKPMFKNAGPKLGKKIGQFTKALQNLDQKEVANLLKQGKKVDVKLDDEVIECGSDLIDVSIVAKKDLSVEMDNNLFVILNTQINEELKIEGIVREFISKIQQMRKTSGFEVADNIEISFNSKHDELAKYLDNHLEFIKNETLAKSLDFEKELETEITKLNDIEAMIQIKKV